MLVFEIEIEQTAALHTFFIAALNEIVRAGAVPVDRQRVPIAAQQVMHRGSESVKPALNNRGSYLRTKSR